MLGFHTFFFEINKRREKMVENFENHKMPSAMNFASF